MAVFSKQVLITELLDRTELVKASTQSFLRLTASQLHFSPSAGKWSIAEIFGHLNIVHDSYIRDIPSRIALAPDVRTEHYHSGWLGEWLYAKMMPRPDGTVFKLPAPKSLHPNQEGLDGHGELQRFLQQCDALDDILRHVSTKDLEGIRIPLSFARLLRLRLGDNLRYMVAHNERHLLQAHRVLQVLPATEAI
ncbi:MAG TPA: DinB family protein [Puia sp.]|nr:DinB family protein [Puia sp.]